MEEAAEGSYVLFYTRDFQKETGDASGDGLGTENTASV